jgi:hypothetical protein
VPIVIPAPEFPVQLRYVWDWFCEIIPGIQGSGFSYPIISWSELDAWARLTGRELSSHEARTIVRLGEKRCAILSEALKSTDGGKG